MRWGFVFAFLRYSRMRHPQLVERMVHAATRNDAIHVAFVPAVMLRVDALLLAPDAYTAFMGKGVTSHPTADLLQDDEYTFVFMPVRDEDTMRRGIDLLHHALGARYNNLSLLATLLPRRLKHSVPRWISCEDEHHMPRGSAPVLFCSQLGLMLCHVVGGVRDTDIDPAACSPGDLERILRANCRACAPHELRIDCRLLV